MKAKLLSIITLVLFVVSLGTYYLDQREGTYELKGTEFLSGLDVGKVSLIEIADKQKRTIKLKREGGIYVVDSENNYPADNKKINETLFKLSSVMIDEEVPEVNDSLLKEFGLVDDQFNYQVILSDAEGTVLKSFFVGEKRGKGNYLKMKNSDKVFVSDKSIWLGTLSTDYIKKEILKIKESDIEKIEVTSNSGAFQLVKQLVAKSEAKEANTSSESKDVKKEGQDVDSGPSGEFKKVTEYKSIPETAVAGGEAEVKKKFSHFSDISFEKPIFNNEMLVGTLNFQDELKLHLQNKLVYKMSLAEKDKKNYLRLTALVGEIPKKIVFNKNDGKDKIKMVGDMAQAQKRSENFNLLHGQWVYEISESLAKKLKFWKKQ